MADSGGFAMLVLSMEGRLAVSLLLVFGGAKLAAELCERVGIQGIIGEILVGVLLGPSALRWVQPSEILTTLAELGVMFLLFRVGLEVDAQELVRIGGTATLVACLGVIVPFLLGWGILSLWGYPRIEAVFVGAAMVATSVGITARVLGTRGLLQLRSSKIILAAAVIDDVLGLLVLAIVSSVARGRINALEILLTCSLACGFVVLVALYGTKAIGKVMPRLGGGIRAQEAEFHVSLVLLFALSLLAIYAGVAAIVGAFMAGMALSASAGQRMRDLTTGATELLVPFFLVGIGLHVDLATFRDPSLALLAGIILVAAVVSKIIGCGAGAVSLGVKEMLRVGVGMVPRGEVGMVVAQLGLAMGVISRPVYGVVVVMAVATTLVAPPLLAAVNRDSG
jgi:Kef-type K+ transport system membrane component KefB